MASRCTSDRAGEPARTVRKALVPLFALLIVSMVVGAAGCGSDAPSSPAANEPSTSSRSDLEGTITVSAATSLTGAFTEIADDFSAANPDVEVTLNFGSSSALSAQILEGAPADVFASANEVQMTRLAAESLLAGDSEIFATNELVIVTRPGNPEGIVTLADLVDAGVVSLCGEEVPCGRYAAQVLEQAGVTVDESSVTRGQNAGATLTAVTEGDAVAAIVYVTDAASAGASVEVVAIPATVNVVATYPIGVLGASEAPEVAEAFVAHVLSDEGQAVLAAYGFGPPT